MHKSSLQHVAAIMQRHASAGSGRVLEVGSHGGAGYRPLFDRSRWKYVGLDLSAGPDVDIVATDPYEWPIADASFDIVVCGQVLEHVEFFWLTILEMRRVVRPGGLILIVAPSRGPQHRHPVDCWRFYPDAWTALAKWGALELLEVNNPWHRDEALDFSSMVEWGDCVGVFRVPLEAKGEPGVGLLSAARKHLKQVCTHDAQDQWPSVRIPHSRDSYLSFASQLKFRFLKHFVRPFL